MSGYDFGQVGGKDCHARVIHKFGRFAGAYPPNILWSKGGIPKSAVPLAPTTCSENKKVYVLGKVWGNLASASELNLGQSGARAGASRGRVWPIPPFDQKSRGYTPL